MSQTAHIAPAAERMLAPRVAFVAGSLVTLALSAAVFAVNELVIAEHLTRLEAAADLFG